MQPFQHELLFPTVPERMRDQAMFHFLLDLLTPFFFSLRIEGQKQAWVSKRFPLHTVTLNPHKVTFWKCFKADVLSQEI